MNAENMTTQLANAAPHSCLRCGRVVTKRAQHEELEERVLAAIRAGHPEWDGADAHGGAHVEHYRRLLRLRKSRSARVRAARRRARVRRRSQLRLVLRVAFTVVALAVVVLAAPVDLQNYLGIVRTGRGRR